MSVCVTDIMIPNPMTNFFGYPCKDYWIEYNGIDGFLYFEVDFEGYQLMFERLVEKSLGTEGKYFIYRKTKKSYIRVESGDSTLKDALEKVSKYDDNR